MLSDAIPDPAQVPPTAPGQVLKGAETEPDTASHLGKHQPNPLLSAHSAPWSPAGSHGTDTPRKLSAQLNKASAS